MRISEFLERSLIIPDLAGTEKNAVIREIAAYVCAQASQGSAPTLSPEVVGDALITRERLGSTGVGEGVAIPHAKIAGLTRLVACFARKGAGVSFDAIDQADVHLLFTLLVPESSAGTHLKALARIARLLKNAAFRDQLMSLSTADEIYDAFTTEDSKYPS